MTIKYLTASQKEDAERLYAAWNKYKAKNKGSSQAWLGAVTGIGTQGAVGQYLLGKMPLNLNSLLSICNVIQVDPQSISPSLMAIVNVGKQLQDMHPIVNDNTSKSSEELFQTPLEIIIRYLCTLNNDSLRKIVDVWGLDLV